MSEPKRYDCYILGGNVGDDPARSDGEFVRYEDYARLKAECQARQAENSVLAVECEHLKAEVDRLAMSEGYHYTAISINTLKEQLHQKHIDYIEARKANEAKVEMINSLKAEVERLTKAADAMYSWLGVCARHNNSMRDDWLCAKKGLPTLTEQWEIEKRNRAAEDAANEPEQEGADL
jgi:hypothetical protein